MKREKAEEQLVQTKHTQTSLLPLLLVLVLVVAFVLVLSPGQPSEAQLQVALADVILLNKVGGGWVCQ